MPSSPSFLHVPITFLSLCNKIPENDLFPAGRKMQGEQDRQTRNPYNPLH
jgi:hypothetical protein